jgi:hypothetical protein
MTKDQTMLAHFINKTGYQVNNYLDLNKIPLDYNAFAKIVRTNNSMA